MAMMESVPTSAILKPTLKDRTSFIASPRRAIRTRPATAEERAEAGFSPSTGAMTILIRMCRGTIKAVVEARPLAVDVTAAADVLAKAEGRPLQEARDAATYLPLISAEDLAVIGHQVMQVRPVCSRCTCGAGYTPLIVGLAHAAAQSHHRPWTVSGIEKRFGEIKAAHPVPIVTTAPGVKVVADAIRTIIRAAGYQPQEV